MVQNMGTVGQPALHPSCHGHVKEGTLGTFTTNQAVACTSQNTSTITKGFRERHTKKYYF